MDVFTQNKNLIRVIIVLITLNIVSIGFFIFKEMRPFNDRLLFPKNEAYKDVSGILQKKLNLSGKQVAQFDEIRKRNFEKQAALKQIIRADKDAMNEEMFNKNTNETKIKQLAFKVCKNEYKMELLRFQQAKELKAVCNDEQLAKLKSLVIEIRDYFRPDNQPRKR
jgi:Spy/CpxP family protein refolding chaperone